jgi:hypothetical protein
MFRNIILVDKEIQEQRYNMCLLCPSFDHEKTKCKECGCFMKIKTKFKHANCPLKKW